MKSEFFKHFGIPITECEVEARVVEDNIPRLFFRSPGNPLVGLDLGGANQLRRMMRQAGETANADEIDSLIKQAQRLR